MSMRSIAHRAGQALACVAALGSGATVAHLTRADAQSTLTPVSVAPTLTATSLPGRSPTSPLDDAVPAEPIPIGVAPPLRDPFGTRASDGMIMTGATRHRLILFTFDDGPELRSTPTLLDALDEAGIKAVFFVNATHFDADTERQRAQGELLNEIVRRGHYLGNHTYHHAPLTQLDHEEIAAELRENEEHIERFTGGRPVLVRPPYGARSPRVDATLAQLGYTQMLWTIGTGDTMVRTAEEVVSLFGRMIRRRENEAGERGGIVLMHDTHGWSVRAFPEIVALLRQKNCELLAQGEELYDFVDDPMVFFAYRGDADPSAIAPPAEPDPVWLEQRQARLREETARRCGAIASR